MKYTVPEIVRTSALVQTRGEYVLNGGQAMGLVIHYSAGRYEDGSKSARQTLHHMGKSGLGCMAMDTDGKLYRAENQTLQQVAYHCGKATWQGKTRLSYYLMGIEVCCAGKLEDATGKTWFGQQVGKENTRKITEKSDNIKPGLYHKFTDLQEASLINFCLWQLDTNPNFNIDFIVGHDEIAPTRKTDPGGSLSMSMPDFRELIRNLHNGNRGSA